MNRDELRKEAARLNIPGRSKMTKDELEAAVNQAQRNNEIAAHVEDPDLSHDQTREGGIGAFSYGNPEQGKTWVDLGYTRDEGGTVYAAPVGTPMPETLERCAKRAQHMAAYSATPQEIFRATHVQRKHRKGQPERGMVWDGIAGDVMPTHHNGRAVGAKHWQQVKRIELVPLADWECGLIRTRRLPNSERVQKYARQNVAQLGMDVEWRKRGATTRPKLPQGQMRRVRKAAHKHGESFCIGAPKYATKVGMSLLARTPEGLGIFYRFAI